MKIEFFSFNKFHKKVFSTELLSYDKAKKYLIDGCAKIVETTKEEESLNIWIPWIHGDMNTGYEISAIREFNWHGRRSWGWEGEDKAVIARSDKGSCRISQNTFDMLVAAAENHCNELNKKGE